MLRTRMSLQKAGFLVTSFFLLAMLIVACGSASSATSDSGNSATTRQSAPRDSSAGGNSNAGQGAVPQPGAANSQSKVVPVQAGPQYLIKTLNVSMQVKDTRKVANDIQSWITSTDPRSSSAGADYTQVADKLYSINLTFSVQSTMYPQIYKYLRDYNLQGASGGKLLGLKESVQDVSNDYVDTESRIKNYKVEQTRLLQLLSHAASVGDIVTVDQKLSEVEGNIETSEAHLKLLADQVTFYTVVLNLQPIIPDGVPQPATDHAWTANGTFGEAFAASLQFGQAVLTFLIWLLAFSIYIVPIAIVTWLVRRYRSRISSIFHHVVASPKATPPAEQS
ncbi:hypothetical protein KDW_51340 [Dictyobacter vulcani]|uniref:DUF4349 domain-containing protein n=1 Tax=Dictyobacter vulcani TaxID=2607529 RepID=A0A5J4KUS5_9CHLR|nr:DUF4349 domain-containing protein [Dictyobacter vulcani]GER90972.1 hypothetical protein KDW_51340 [Dictyobacter vulcani]